MGKRGGKSAQKNSSFTTLVRGPEIPRGKGSKRPQVIDELRSMSILMIITEQRLSFKAGYARKPGIKRVSIRMKLALALGGQCSSGDGNIVYRSSAPYPPTHRCLIASSFFRRHTHNPPRQHGLTDLHAVPGLVQRTRRLWDRTAFSEESTFPFSKK